MKSYIVLALALVAAVAAFEQPLLYYHSAVGIELAKKIKQYESALDFDGSASRIAGGSPAAANAHPHLGGLLITLRTGSLTVCGSSMLNHRRAVTAAHCWNDGYHSAVTLTVVYGNNRLFSGGTRITTNNVQTHAQYNHNNLQYDVAIISHAHVGYTDNIKPIRLASGSNTFVNYVATAAGYGRTGDNVGIGQNQVKSHVSMLVISNQQCAQTFGTSWVTGLTICTSGAGGRSICPGDSGGPLTVGEGDNRHLIGITTFVALAGCTRGFPSGFGRITAYHDWIRQRI